MCSPAARPGALAVAAVLLFAGCAGCGGGARNAAARAAGVGPAATPTSTGGTAGGGATPAAACPAGFTSALAAGRHESFASGGQRRSFVLRLPAASFSGARPLLVAFHGTGLSAERAIADYGLEAWVDAGSVVIAPDSNGNGTVWPVWDALAMPGTQPAVNADLALFDDLVRCVSAHHPIDAARVFVAGHSAGGAMVNFLLGRRSAVLAGGVAASGSFDLTQPDPPQPVDPVTVIVTWGGANDFYSGSAGAASVENVGYAEQAVIASQYWTRQPGTRQIACRGDDVGHAWLSPIGTWMRDVLLASPKGGPRAPLPPLPARAGASCSETPATYEPPVTVRCGASSVEGCQRYCQLLGTCVVENGTLGPPAARALGDLGFADVPDACSGCVARCEQDARGSAADAAALACIAAARPACGAGIAGAALFADVGRCCAEAPGSRVCARYCAAFGRAPGMEPLLSGCR
jgi:poly(3-hydroxybutyrate) depolymerase